MTTFLLMKRSRKLSTECLRSEIQSENKISYTKSSLGNPSDGAFRIGEIYEIEECYAM